MNEYLCLRYGVKFLLFKNILNQFIIIGWKYHFYNNIQLCLFHTTADWRDSRSILHNDLFLIHSNDITGNLDHLCDLSEPFRSDRVCLWREQKIIVI